MSNSMASAPIAARMRVVTRPAIALFVVLAAACTSRRPPREEPWPARNNRSGIGDAGSGSVPTNLAGTDLEPGTIRAYGLLMPVGTVERLVTDATKIYYVQAPMPRVMRYLQRRLEITTGDIHPLGAMIRNARVRTTPDGQSIFLDVGVRDEGDRTLVTLWDRTPVPAAQGRSLDDSLRAAGIDPQTRRPAGTNNR